MRLLAENDSGLRFYHSSLSLGQKKDSCARPCFSKKETNGKSDGVFPLRYKVGSFHILTLRREGQYKQASLLLLFTRVGVAKKLDRLLLSPPHCITLNTYRGTKIEDVASLEKVRFFTSRAAARSRNGLSSGSSGGSGDDN